MQFQRQRQLLAALNLGLASAAVDPRVEIEGMIGIRKQFGYEKINALVGP